MIVDQARSSFLWTILILNELLDAYSEEDINFVLGEIPPQIEALYQRILQSISRLSRGKPLAKANLTWTTWLTRLLTLAELDGAIRLDAKEHITDETVAGLCGQLVTVDKSGRVRMIHATAREFLLDEKLVSELSGIRETAVHDQLAKIRLSYLVSAR